MSSTTGPFFTTALVALSIFGGTGVWYSYPSHQHLVKERVGQLTEKVEAALHSAKVTELLARFSGNAGGKFDAFDLDMDGDGKVTHEDLQNLLSAVSSDEFHVGPFHSKESFIAFIVVDIVIILVVALLYHMHTKRISAINAKGTLTVTIVKAAHLLNVDGVAAKKAAASLAKSGPSSPASSPKASSPGCFAKGPNVSDPYALAKVGTQKFHTETVKNNLAPTWNPKNSHKFKVDCSNKKEDTLLIEVWDGKDGLMDMFHSDRSLGHVSLDIGAVFKPRAGETVEKTLHLEGVNTGVITVKACYVPDPLKPAAKPAPKPATKVASQHH